MTYILCGAAGMLAALGLLALGVMLGWMVRTAREEHTRKAVAVEESERQRLIAEQKAFETLLNYSAHVAYGMDSAAPWAEEDSE